MNLVLVHGILGFREKFGVEYFNGIKERLSKYTPNILIPQLEATGTTSTCGEQLREAILAAFASGALDRDGETHIIGHSQGGLNARYMLSPKNPNSKDLAGKITSLTTISSPHQGSPIPDLLALKPVDHDFKSLELLIHDRDLGQDIVRVMLARLGVNPDALTDLGTEAMKKFNLEYPDNPDVHYFSVAGAGRAQIPQTSLFLYEFYHHIKSLTGEDNDGLVTVPSAQRWPEGAVIWPADHADEIGHDLNSPELKPLPGWDYLAAWEAIVNNVS
jgi:triacylglycerol lipase